MPCRSRRSDPRCARPGPRAPSGWRQPEDANPPAPLYFDLGTACNRWWTWQASGAYGTDSILPGRIYPLDGNRFVPGSDPAHLGGDTWSADAAITVIRNDPGWRGMLVSLGGIDKLGHMWGPEDMETGPPGSDQEMRHLPFVAKNADVQVGRIVDALQARGLLDETLIVVTADHAAQTGRSFHGRFDGFPPPDGIGCAPATGSTGLRSDCKLVLRPRRGRGLSRSEPRNRRLPGRPDASGRGPQPPLLVPGRPRRRLAERPLAGPQARGGRGRARPAGRDRELPPEPRPGRLQAVRDEPDEPGGALVVQAPRGGARRHDGGAVRTGRHRASSTRT
jgi:Type I phosphodiesterase / nucleotide pyrophosphatase